jgi:F0F1-type ATP synthase assembly protein I
MKSDSRGTPVLGLMLRLGAILLMSVAFGFGLGLYIDSLAGTRPLFMLILSLVGISLGSLFGFRLVMAAVAEVEREAALARARREAERSDTPPAEE